MKRTALLAMLLASAPASAGQKLNAHFVNDRVLVDAPLTDGRRIRFFTDSGGGGTFITPETAARLHLAVGPITGPAASELPKSFRQLRDPLPMARSPFPTPPSPQMVAPDQLAAGFHLPSESDGMLGNNWFAGHIWTWDYPAGALIIEARFWQPARSDRVVPVTFRPASGGRPALHFPRIIIELAGERVPMLLDTGATTVLTPEVAAKLGGPRLRATSMIVASKIAAWREAHPDWRVIENAQSGTGARMIEVPDVRIAGLAVGPIWFTERPDQNFHGMMSASMDGQVEGAIGGNALHSLRMTVDYPHGRAAFRRG